MNKKINIIEAIESIYPNPGSYENQHELNFYCPDPYDYSTLEWSCNLVKPTEDEVFAEINRLQAEYDAKSYQRIRSHRYPEIGDQLDAIWHSLDADSDLKLQFSSFYNMIKTVKDENPKS